MGLHRVVEPPGVLPQAAWRLDPDPEIGPDEVRVAVRVSGTRTDGTSHGLTDWLREPRFFTPWVERG